MIEQGGMLQQNSELKRINLELKKLLDEHMSKIELINPDVLAVMQRSDMPNANLNLLQYESWEDLNCLEIIFK